MKRLLQCALGLVLVTSAAAAQDSANPLYDELVRKGIPIPEGPTVKLPGPLFKPGQAPANNAALLDEAAGRVPPELFVRRTFTAPFSLTIDSVDKAADERCAQMIRLRFVAYGKLQSLVETDFVAQLLAGKGKSGSGGRALSSEELTKRGIRLLQEPKVKEDYGPLALTLLEKVEVTGVTRSLRTVSSSSVLAATRLDDRFREDKEHPNRWRHTLRLGDEDRLGPPHPYAGLGGYVLVTELPTPKDALLVEMYFLLHEPQDWFGGRNLLRSKMPIVIQDNVRSFRRKLMRAED